VVSLEPDGPAVAAGIRDGDLIVSLDDQVVGGLDDLHRLLTESKIGTKVRLGVLRGADRRDIEVPVKERA
jgi:S1-C subfamily serine protease